MASSSRSTGGRRSAGDTGRHATGMGRTTRWYLKACRGHRVSETRYQERPETRRDQRPGGTRRDQERPETRRDQRPGGTRRDHRPGETRRDQRPGETRRDQQRPGETSRDQRPAETRRDQQRPGETTDQVRPQQLALQDPPADLDQSLPQQELRHQLVRRGGLLLAADGGQPQLLQQLQRPLQVGGSEDAAETRT
ncbi:hypothetical protein EYF80_032405 [Liparis tanakae]|uniref:Uncharacterized protein n=1 Tax=Liparis tanakae TaxID=230148 RepID=A0A4Z2GV63_9TELE|nr:hypothetical protein EYF80_032405 [Liparis tanakae]